MKKLLISILLLLLLFGLYGCGGTGGSESESGKQEISLAIENLSKANSYEYTTNIEEVTMIGDKKIVSKIVAEQKIIVDPYTVWSKTDTRITRKDGEKERTIFEIYQEEHNDQLDVNIRSISPEASADIDQEPALSQWEKSTNTDKATVEIVLEMSKNDFDVRPGLLSSIVDSFQLVKDKEPKNLNRYDGYIDSKAVLNAYKLYLRDPYVRAKLLPDLENPSLEDLKTEIRSGDYDILQVGVPKLAYSDEPIPISIWINKETHSIEKVVIDETSVLQALYESIEINQDLGVPVVSKSLYTFEITGINTLKEIPMPE